VGADDFEELRHRLTETHAHACRAPAPACPTRAGSKVGLEVMPITSVTLSEGHGPGERSPSRRSGADLASAQVLCCRSRSGRSVCIR
jgi:hypothetical protein